MKKILITGSNGLLGQKLVELISKNFAYQLIATSRGENRLKTKDGYFYTSLDICIKEEIDNVIALHKPDYVIHTAAMTNVDQCESEKEHCLKMNVEAVKNIAEACKVNNAFLIHLSTDFIFDGTAGPYKEDDLPNPLSFYGQSKLDAEALVKESGCKWAIVRTVIVYGVAQDMSRSNIVLWVKNNLEQSKAINVVNDQWRTPTLAEDLAKGCMLIVENNTEGVFNISGEEMLTPFEMAIKTADFFGLNKNLIQQTDGSKFSQPAKRPPKTGFIIEKAKKILGYNPHTFEEGLAVLKSQLDNQ
jgi:dTDP-4-dehydrorhamnose reductase